MPGERSFANKLETGNVLFFILLAIVLIAALTAAIVGTSEIGQNIDRETLILRVSQTRSYASELERAVRIIMQNGKSETDLRFAHPDAPADYGDLNNDPDSSDQIFAKNGGGASYQPPAPGINDGSKWEFYGNTSLPQTGSDLPELIAVLPNVSAVFCEAVDKALGYSSGTVPEDSGACLYAGNAERFDDGRQYSSTPNTISNGSFSNTPALEACLKCTSNDSYHFYHVLLIR